MPPLRSAPTISSSNSQRISLMVVSIASLWGVAKLDSPRCLSSSGGGSGGPRPSSDLKEDGCPGDRGNEALLSDVDLNRVEPKSKVRSHHPPRTSSSLLSWALPSLLSPQVPQLPLMVPLTQQGPRSPSKLAATPVMLRV